MSGVIALHGGGEFLAGDERFLRRVLAASVAADGGPLRVVIVPTAAARGRPELAAQHGIEAFGAAADAAGIDVTIEVADVIDAETAADPDAVARLAGADLIYLPGGDPDIIPTLYPGSAAWIAMEAAWERGATIAGASAGAMALAPWTWTPTGGIDGLGLVPGIIVLPHADAGSWSRNVARYRPMAHASLDILGLAERTGVLVHADGRWEVVGEGMVRWLPADADPDETIVARDGDRLHRG